MTPEGGLKVVPRQPCVRSAIAFAEASADQRMRRPVTSLGGLALGGGHVPRERAVFDSPGADALPDDPIDISLIDPCQPLPALSVLPSVRNYNANTGARMPKSREESGGGRTRVLWSARRRCHARRALLLGTAGSRRRVPRGGSQIALRRFALMWSCSRFREMQSTVRVAMSCLQHGRCHSESVRETGHVTHGRRSEAASRPSLPRQRPLCRNGRPCLSRTVSCPHRSCRLPGHRASRPTARHRPRAPAHQQALGNLVQDNVGGLLLYAQAAGPPAAQKCSRQR